MTREEKIRYLANVALIAAVDGALTPAEATAIERVRLEMAASKDDLHAALQTVAKGGYSLEPVGRYSEKVKNLEDMLLVSLSDRDLAGSEKPEILAFAKKINLSQGQLTTIFSETRNRLKSQPLDCLCPSCEKPIPPSSKYCPGCGEPIPASGQG